MNQFDVMAELTSTVEYIELCVTNTQELKRAIIDLRKMLDLRKVKFESEGER